MFCSNLYMQKLYSAKKKKVNLPECEETNDAPESRRGKCAAAVSLPAFSLCRGTLNRPDTKLQSSSTAGVLWPLTGNSIVTDCDSEERAVTRGDAPQRGCQTAQRNSLIKWSGEES